MVPVVQPVTEKYEHLLIKKEKQYESPTPWEVSPLQEFPQQVGILRVPKVSNDQFMGDVIGLVAQLGTVGTGDLSRVLAEYLGQDQMLAIVCRSFEAAGALENFVQKPKKPMHGEVDSMHVLCEPALLQKPTHGRSFVFCLEDIRPYTGDFDRSDPQRKLALPDPVLPSGMAPDGFLGYAVNMVDLDSHHIHTLTSAGHGLRETVLYCLLGELQVYKTREDMLAARGCIKHGAISLDGGILEQNGVTSFGVGDVEISFPVAKNLELPPSTNVDDVEKQIEEKSAESRVRAKPSSKVGKWALLDEVQPPLSRVRVGSVFPPLSIACYDVNGNQIPFATTLEVAVKVQTNEGLLFRVEKFNKDLSNHTLTIKDMLMASGELDKLRPTYEATLVVCSEDPDKFSVLVPCEVIPGYLQSAKAVPPIFDNQVLPGYIIKEFILEMFDQYGNHVIEGTEVLLKLDGFSIQDQLGTARTVNHQGCIDLSGLLKVTAGYEKCVSISVLNLQFQTEKRVLIMHTLAEAACGRGTTLGFLKFNRGLLGFHDSRETHMYPPYYICDSKNKFRVISKTSNLYYMMAGVTEHCESLAIAISAEVWLFEEEFPGGFVSIETALQITQTILERKKVGNECFYGGIIIGWLPNKDYQAYLIGLEGSTVVKPVCLNDTVHHLVVGGGARCGDMVLSRIANPQLSEDDAKEGSLLSMLGAAYTSITTGGKTHVYVFRHQEKFNFNASHSEFDPLQVHLDNYTFGMYLILLVVIKKPVELEFPDFEEHMNHRPGVACTSRVVEKSGYLYYRVACDNDVLANSIFENLVMENGGATPSDDDLPKGATPSDDDLPKGATPSDDDLPKAFHRIQYDMDGRILNVHVAKCSRDLLQFMVTY